MSDFCIWNQQNCWIMCLVSSSLHLIPVCRRSAGNCQVLEGKFGFQPDNNRNVGQGAQVTRQNSSGLQNPKRCSISTHVSSQRALLESIWNAWRGTACVSKSFTSIFCLPKLVGNLWNCILPSLFLSPRWAYVNHSDFINKTDIVPGRLNRTLCSWSCLRRCWRNVPQELKIHMYSPSPRELKIHRFARGILGIVLATSLIVA